MKVTRLLASVFALALASTLYFVAQGEWDERPDGLTLARGGDREDSSGKEAPRAESRVSAEELANGTESARTEAAESSPVVAQVAHVGPNQLALTLVGPNGTSFQDLVRKLEFGYDPYIEMRAVREPSRVAALRIGKPPEGETLHIASRRASELDDAGLVGSFALAPNHAGFCVEWILEGRVVQVRDVPGGSFEQVRFYASSAEIEQNFGSISVEVTALGRRDEFDGSVETHTPHSHVERELDDSGRATLRALPAGEYTVTVQASKLHPETQTTPLLPGEHVDLSFLLLRAQSVRGRILGASDEIAHRQVALCSVTRGADVELGAPLIVESDEAGLFEFPAVRPGEWVVRVIRRKQYRKMLEFPPKFGEDAETWTPSGKLEGEHYGGIRSYLFRLEDQRESNWVAIDTRNGPVEGVELQLETSIAVTIRNELDEASASIELFDTNGYPVTELPVANERRFLALSGELVVRTKVGDKRIGERRFSPTQGLLRLRR